MLAILNSLNAHNFPIFEPILITLVSKLMVHRVRPDKTYLTLGLLSPLSDANIPSQEEDTTGTLNCPTDYTVEDNIHNLQVNLLSMEEISQQVARLNSEQQAIFNVIQTHFLSHCTSPLHIFC